MKKKLISSFVMVLCLMTCYTACGQNNTQNMGLSQQERQQLQQIESINDTMSFRRDYEIVYENSGCSIDVRVNDGYVVKSFRTNNEWSSTSVNASIMHSGKQKITIRITPPKGQELLMPDSVNFYFDLDYTGFGKAGSESSSGNIWRLSSDRVEIPEQGIPYLEIEGEFEARVPYSIERWTNCIDLRNIPDIEQRVVAEFKRIRQLMVDRDYDSIKKMYLTKHKELMIPLYRRAEEQENDWMEYVKNIAKASPKYWAEIEDYELVFYANGRLVTLESKKRKGYNSALLYIIPKEIYVNGRKIEYTNEHDFCLHLGIKQGTNTLVSF